MGARGSLRQNGRQKSLVCDRDSVGKGREFVSHSTSGRWAAMNGPKATCWPGGRVWARRPDDGSGAKCSGMPWGPERLSCDWRDGAAQGWPACRIVRPAGHGFV